MEVARKSKDKLFHGLLKAVRLGLQSPPIGHSTSYGKYVLNKHIGAKNLEKRYY